MHRSADWTAGQRFHTFLEEPIACMEADGLAEVHARYYFMQLASSRHPGPRRCQAVLPVVAGLLGAFLTAAAASTDAASLADVFVKQPYLIYRGDPTEMQVLWQLGSTSSATIEWGVDETYSAGSTQTAEFGGDHQHGLTITGLIPG